MKSTPAQVWFENSPGKPVTYEGFVETSERLRKAFEAAHEGKACSRTLYSGGNITAVDHPTADKTRTLATVAFSYESLSELTKEVWANTTVVRSTFYGPEGHEDDIACVQFSVDEDPFSLEYIVSPPNAVIFERMTPS